MKRYKKSIIMLMLISITLLGGCGSQKSSDEIHDDIGDGNSQEEADEMYDDVGDSNSQEESDEMYDDVSDGNSQEESDEIYDDVSDENSQKESDEMYDNIGVLMNGVAIVSKDGKDGLIKNGGDVLIPPKYDLIMPDNAEIYLVEQDGLWGYIDPSTGNEIIKPQFEEAYLFDSNGEAQVRIGLDFFVINLKGEIVRKAE